MAKKTSFSLKEVSAVDKGAPFVQLTYELLNSPSWRAMSLPCRKLLEFLMLEHMAHAGSENGRLIATYNQLEKFGIARNNINKAIEEAESLGLILVERGMQYAANKSHLNHFQLTFLVYHFTTSAGVKMYSCPDNEWRLIKDHDIERIKGRKPKRLSANQKIDFDGTKIH